MARKAAGTALALALTVPIAGCGRSSPRETSPPDRVEAIAGSPFKRVVLTPQGAQRIGIQTALVRRARAGPHRSMETVIPYPAVIYDNAGRAFTYTRPLPFQYIRRPVVVDHITGSLAFLSSGPPPGTRVVTVGAEELYGAELGVTE
jgi:hypothetical protein